MTLPLDFRVAILDMTRPQLWGCDPVHQYTRTNTKDWMIHNNETIPQQRDYSGYCYTRKINHCHKTEHTDSLVAVCNICAKNLAALFFDTYFNTNWNSASRLRFPWNAVGPVNSAMYFHNCGMSISRSSANSNICSTLKEIIRYYGEMIM